MRCRRPRLAEDAAHLEAALDGAMRAVRDMRHHDEDVE
jgi:hypothetical protein